MPEVATTRRHRLAILAILCVAAVAFLYRPLMLSSLLPDVAQARGVSAFGVQLAFLAVVALATTMTVPVVGTLLIFALMVGAPACARSFTDRPARAMALSVAIALAIVWASIAASYTTDYPVGFFVGTVSAASYTASRSWSGLRRRTRNRRRARRPPAALAPEPGLESAF